MTSIVLPLHIVSEMNARECWRAKHARAKLHRCTARMMAHNAGIRPGTESYTVRLIRTSPRALDDDNLAAGFKAVRDGIADALGINDRDPRVVWKYGQERQAKVSSCRVEIERRTT